jgi:hypothetical protein
LFGTLVKKRDFYAGGLMTLLGAAVTLDSMTYSLGTLTHMGLAGPIFFIILGEFFGLVPATFSCVFVSAMGDRSATWKGSAILAAGVTFVGTLLFTYVLKIPFPMFRFGH